MKQKEIQIPTQNKKGEQLAMHFQSLREMGASHCGYSLEMSTKPQTIGYSLADSPVGLAAWTYEKHRDWSHHDGDVEKVFSKDEMLDTIMLYWFTNSGTSSGRYYWECREHVTTGYQIDMPVGVSWFPGDTSYGPREWCERYYKNIVHWKEVERGGHFAAWEVPDLFVSEVLEWKGKIS